MENFFRFPFAAKRSSLVHIYFIYIPTNYYLFFKKEKKTGYEIPGPSFIRKGRECTISDNVPIKQQYCHLHSLSLCHTPRIYSCRCFDLYFVFTDCSSPTTRAVESTTFVETFLIILPLYLPLRKSSRTARPTLFLLPEWFPPISTSALFQILSYPTLVYGLTYIHNYDIYYAKLLITRY
jgi:hypothetical protein